MFVGDPKNNYVRLSNMVFRIMGLDENNDVILVAEEDVANVNFSKLEKWLDEVYIEHFTDEAKKLLVKSKFCNMKIAEDNLDIKKCSSYTQKRYAYVPSVIDINNARDGDYNFLVLPTYSWTGNSLDEKVAYTTSWFQLNDYYLKRDLTFNYGVRPKIVIKGDIKILSGDGTQENPYTFGEVNKAKNGELLNNRYCGEYITIDGSLYRIIETLEDGTTKVIGYSSIGEFVDAYSSSNEDEEVITFDPKNKNSYAYFINNNASKFVNASFFVPHEVSVPIYKNNIIYGDEKKFKEYKVKISPPSLYDMFSSSSFAYGKPSRSYWLINTSESNKRIVGAISDTGVPYNERIPYGNKFGIKVVAFIKKNTAISSGNGTYYSPYRLD